MEEACVAVHLLVKRGAIDEVVDLLGGDGGEGLAGGWGEGEVATCDLDGAFGRVGCARDGTPLRRRANWAPERSSLILSMEMVSLPAMSLSKMTLPAVTLSSLPVS